MFDGRSIRCKAGAHITCFGMFCDCPCHSNGHGW